MDMFALEKALVPRRDGSARVSLRRGVVTGAGLVQTAADEEGRPVDGPAVEVGAEGAVLSVDGHRQFLPYGGSGGGGTAGPPGPPGAMAAGTVTIAHPGGAATKAGSITFPAGMFATAPIVIATVTNVTDTARAAHVTTGAYNGTAGYVSVDTRAGSLPAGDVTVNWIAVAP